MGLNEGPTNPAPSIWRTGGVEEVTTAMTSDVESSLGWSFESGFGGVG